MNSVMQFELIIFCFPPRTTTWSLLLYKYVMYKAENDIDLMHNIYITNVYAYHYMLL